MIRDKMIDTTHAKNICVTNGDGINLQRLRNMILITREGLPLECYEEDVKFGGMIGGTIERCLILYHPNHQKDYKKTILRVKQEGKRAFVTIEHLQKTEPSGSWMPSLTKNRAKLEDERNWNYALEGLLDGLFA